jgi:O-antigen ligase
MRPPAMAGRGIFCEGRAPMLADRRAQSAFELGLDITAVLFLPILVLASRGTAPLAGFAGLCALGLAAPNPAAAWRRVRRHVPLLAALLLWGLVSALWAIEPRRSVLTALRLAALFAAGLALIAAASEMAAPRRLWRCLIAGFVLSLVLAVAQSITGGALTARFATRVFLDAALNNVEDGFGLLLLPLCAILVLRRQRLAAAALAVATIAAVALLAGQAARIAFVAGVLAVAPLCVWRCWLSRVALVASVLLILAAPLCLPPLGDIAAVHRVAQTMKDSVWHRLEIWAFVGGKIAERPVLGWGLDASRAIPGGDAPIPEGYPGQTMLPLHPHNAALQLWLELGAPGALLFAWLVARVWRALGDTRWPRLYAAAAGGSLVAALIIGFGSYGVWQEWWIATEFLTLFLILALAPLAQPSPDTRTGSIS